MRGVVLYTSPIGSWKSDRGEGGGMRGEVGRCKGGSGESFKKLRTWFGRVTSRSSGFLIDDAWSFDLKKFSNLVSLILMVLYAC